MSEYHKILAKYWGYNAFRELQEEIILSLSKGQDTLGLMPTGGGKSITFQVFSLSKEGICLVITPLIALMKDQVYNLQRRGIKALAIYSGMSRAEIEIAYNNATNGNFKFLYLSPERLQTEQFQARLKQMNVNLIAVDESHCISQWGYDFRPSYLEIANVREILPDIPVLALTATATPEVANDIQDKLKFKKKNLLKKSFVRENLAYVVRETENKGPELLKIAQRISGSAVVYVRSRNKTKQVADYLKSYGFSADYYHAGLTKQIRESKQEAWQLDKIRIMVSTNAFGMGIDKPDVRWVAHLDLPDNLEAYFQEAGRGGRDEKKAYAVLLYNSKDILKLKKRLITNFPEIEKIKRVYEALCNYYQIPIGAGAGMSYDFDIFDFSKKFKLDVNSIHYSLQVLMRHGYLEVSEEVNNPARAVFNIRRDDLYKFQVANKNYDAFIKLLLRSYTGIFSKYTPISEELLAQRAGVKIEIIIDYLKHLKKLHILEYIPRKNKPLVTFLEERLPLTALHINASDYNNRKKRFSKRIESVIHYASTTKKCRSRILLEYFGQKKSKLCGQCDFCLNKKDNGLSQFEFNTIKESLKITIKAEPYLLTKLISISKYSEAKTLIVIDWLFDNEFIARDENNCIKWIRD